MNKMEFLDELEHGLTALRPEDRRQALDYYAEMIADGVENGASEEEVVDRFDAPETIAAQLIAEYGAIQRTHIPTADRTPDEPREYCPEGDVHTVVVQARTISVRVCHSADGRVRVRFAPREGEQITAEEADGVFRFTYKPPLFRMNLFFNINIERREIVLELPHGFSGTACAKTTDSGIRAGDLTLGGTVQLVTSNSSIHIDRGTFDALRCKTSNSSIVLTDTNARDCEAATSNSSITADHCAFDSYLCKTSNSNIKLLHTTGGSCEAVTDNAGITAEHSRFARRLWLTTSNGRIRVHTIEAPDIVMVTSNAPIKGTVLGAEEDYAVTSRTSNAHNGLRDTSGADRPGRLRAITSNGKIDLRFVDRTAAEAENEE